MDKHLPSTPQTTVLVLDDYPLESIGIFAAIFQSSYEVVGLEGRKDIRENIQKYRPNIVIIGVELEDLRNTLFMDRLSKECQPRFVFLTEAAIALPALLRRVKGVRGVLHRQAGAEELLVCLDTVSRGDVYISPRLVARTPLTSAKVPGAQRPNRITWREMEIIELVQLGSSNREIGISLGINSSTVSSHLQAIYKKLGARNRTQLALASLLLEKSDLSKKRR